jgi:aspartate 1-decarboxylase
MYLKEKLSAKIHNGVVTQSNKDYMGSVTIGQELLYASGIEPNDKVQVLNITNGQRIETYVIEGEGREICLNGAAAHLFSIGDRVIIIAYLYEIIGRLSQGGIYNGDIYNDPEKLPPIKIVILDGTENNNILTIRK